jgi:hypothetical protein
VSCTALEDSWNEVDGPMLTTGIQAFTATRLRCQGGLRTVRIQSGYTRGFDQFVAVA